jgi:hypothetical protein
MTVSGLARHCLWLCLVIALCGTTAAWADGIYDANKPFPVPANDLSCWMASAADMMAADYWATTVNGNGDVVGDPNSIYAVLKANPAFQQGTGWRGGFQDQALTYYDTLTGIDPDESIDVYNSWGMPWQGVADTNTATPRSLRACTKSPFCLGFDL